MAIAKSPFVIMQGFLSPLQCEEIVDKLAFYEPDKSPEGNPLKMMRHHDEAEEIIYNRFEPVIPKLQEYYGGYDHMGTERISFEYYPQECETEPLCENSNWIRKKWVMTKNRSLSCLLFLSEYNENPDFDTDYEVFGGKFSFPTHQFGFLPERGTLIIYPSGPHFINATEKIKYGDLFQARFHLQSKMPMIYQPSDYPGNFKTWFKDLM